MTSAVPPPSLPAPFDHAVVMVRDRLDAIAPRYQAQGFCLSDTALHNLGSCNRLIVLADAYVELLGWPAGKPPARAEIAASPMGLEALVFRTDDPEATRARLLAAGLAANPVQELLRPATLDGQAVIARFRTVRFAEQPLPGVRMYFCQHLVPGCVWSPALMAHPNGAHTIARIQIEAPDAAAAAQVLGVVAGAVPQAVPHGWTLLLPNLSLDVHVAPHLSTPRIAGLVLAMADGSLHSLDTHHDAA